MKIQGTEGGRKSISPSCFLLVLAVLAQPTASTSTTGSPASSTIITVLSPATSSSSSATTPANSLSPTTQTTTTVTPGSASTSTDGSASTSSTNSVLTVTSTPGSSIVSGTAPSTATGSSPTVQVDCYHHQCSGLSLETLCLSDHISNTSISVPTCEAAYCKVTLREKNFITIITSECADTTCQLQTTAETSAQPREVVNCCRTHLCNLDTFVEFSAAEIVGPRFLASLGMVLTATLLTI
ncbi:uncharacterized protein [Littorina saxatilis]|uniref:uncharacterized protein n=1 Tax=Littorina saxatilis TaxID=31220 RepID=UPI0038B45AC8